MHNFHHASTIPKLHYLQCNFHFIFVMVMLQFRVFINLVIFFLSLKKNRNIFVLIGHLKLPNTNDNFNWKRYSSKLSNRVAQCTSTNAHYTVLGTRYQVNVNYTKKFALHKKNTQNEKKLMHCNCTSNVCKFVKTVFHQCFVFQMKLNNLDDGPFISIHLH